MTIIAFNMLFCTRADSVSKEVVVLQKAQRKSDSQSLLSVLALAAVKARMLLFRSPRAHLAHLPGLSKVEGASLVAEQRALDRQDEVKPRQHFKHEHQLAGKVRLRVSSRHHLRSVAVDAQVMMHHSLQIREAVVISAAERHSARKQQVEILVVHSAAGADEMKHRLGAHLGDEVDAMSRLVGVRSEKESGETNHLVAGVHSEGGPRAMRGDYSAEGPGLSKRARLQGQEAVGSVGDRQRALVHLHSAAPGHRRSAVRVVLQGRGWTKVVLSAGENPSRGTQVLCLAAPDQAEETRIQAMLRSARVGLDSVGQARGVQAVDSIAVSLRKKLKRSSKSPCPRHCRMPRSRPGS